MKEVYERLMNLAYDDNYGITYQKQDYEEQINLIKKKLKRVKVKKTKEHLKRELKRTKKELKEFKPMWISVDDLKKELLKTQNKEKKTRTTWWRNNWSEVILIVGVSLGIIFILMGLGVI